MINNLKSFTQYSFRIYAINELGSSPKSPLLTIETLESGMLIRIEKIKNKVLILFFEVPLAMITDLTAILLNNSSMRITWIFENNDWQYLHGKFRTFAVTIYQNFSKNS
jgi:hypothetical protein